MNWGQLTDKQKSDALTTSDLHLHPDGVYRHYRHIETRKYRSHATDAMDYFMLHFVINNPNIAFKNNENQI